MAATNLDIQVFAGEDNPAIPFTIFQPGGNTPQDITGWTLKFAVCPILGGADLVVKTSPASGVTITNSAAGKGTIALLQADLVILQYSTVWNYRLERTDAGFDNWQTLGRLSIRARGG